MPGFHLRLRGVWIGKAQTSKVASASVCRKLSEPIGSVLAATPADAILL